ncbi:MAG TPA: hypothetical protein VGP72_12365 [Planctomycetota bacterium]|jgi:hypothetical protein
MRIGVFSTGHNRQARRLVLALERLQPGSTLFFDISLDPPERTSMDAGRICWNGVDLTTLDAAFLHGFTYLDPVIPSGDIDVDWSLWREDYIEQQMKYTYLYSLLTELERRGVRLINPPAAHLRAFMKTALLERLRENGLAVPSLLCTNSPEAAQEFCRGAGCQPAGAAKVVWHPACGRGAWQPFFDRQRQALVSIKRPPILLAGLQEGPLVRAFVSDGKPLLILGRCAPQQRPDVAEETLEQFFEVPAAEVRESIRRAAEVLNIPWFQLLFIQAAGRAWIYDVEADPLLDSLPLPHQEQITGLLAEQLLGVRPQYEAPLQVSEAAAQPQQRPTVFLRRMLQVLFDFEKSKYS